MSAARYLFVVENFIPYGVETRHALEHHFEVDLDRERVAPTRDCVAFHRIAIDELGRNHLPGNFDYTSPAITPQQFPGKSKNQLTGALGGGAG